MNCYFHWCFYILYIYLLESYSMVKLFIDVQRFTASIHCSRFDWVQWIFIYNVSCLQKHIQLQINVFKCVPLKAYHMVTHVAIHLYRIKPILYVMSNF